uniref:Myb-like domain-containing protein n=1 Tax=Brassica oleracea var. oleracea TaxID=109376 RepID=A0A0D3DCC0_BRAOL
MTQSASLLVAPPLFRDLSSTNPALFRDLFSMMNQSMSLWIALLDDYKPIISLSTVLLDIESLLESSDCLCLWEMDGSLKRYEGSSNQRRNHNCDRDSVQLCSLPDPLIATQPTEASSRGEETPAERRERRKWTHVDDVVLISSWLNTSKNPIVGNEQKSGAFWKRIATYFAASPKVARSDHREAVHCKKRWHKINDLVNKFCGAYEAASREKSSGQNENDVLKLAHEIFFNNHNKKFKLEHAWKELRNDQKLTCEGTTRPPGVKASKGNGKQQTKAEGKALAEFQSMWSIKKEDLAIKERLSKMKLLDSLLAKQEPLADYEEALKKKIITELLS